MSDHENEEQALERLIRTITDQDPYLVVWYQDGLRNVRVPDNGRRIQYYAGYIANAIWILADISQKPTTVILGLVKRLYDSPEERSPRRKVSAPPGTTLVMVIYSVDDHTIGTKLSSDTSSMRESLTWVLEAVLMISQLFGEPVDAFLARVESGIFDPDFKPFRPS